MKMVAFQPRFGLAWSPWGDKTVIRTGVGLFADLYPGTVLSPIDTNFPQLNLWNIAGGKRSLGLEAPRQQPHSRVAVFR